MQTTVMRTDDTTFPSCDILFDSLDAFVTGFQYVLIDVLVSCWLKILSVKARLS